MSTGADRGTSARRDATRAHAAEARAFTVAMDMKVDAAESVPARGDGVRQAEGTSGNTLSSLQKARQLAPDRRLRNRARRNLLSHSEKTRPAGRVFFSRARCSCASPVPEARARAAFSSARPSRGRVTDTRGIHEDRRRLRALREAFDAGVEGSKESRGEGVALETQRRAAKSRDTDSHDRLMPRSNAHLAHRVVPGRLLAACVVGMSVSGVAAARLGPSGAHALARPSETNAPLLGSAELEHNSPERRGVLEVAAEGLFDIFGFEVGGTSIHARQTTRSSRTTSLPSDPRRSPRVLPVSTRNDFFHPLDAELDTRTYDVNVTPGSRLFPSHPKLPPRTIHSASL